MFPTALLMTEINGYNGVVINGSTPSEQIGWSVNFVGDLNSDGIDDLAIGAPWASPSNQLRKAGKVYVIFGKTGIWPDQVNLTTLSMANGFTVTGLNPRDGLGWSVAGLGDINGDQVDDFIIGAPFADPPVTKAFLEVRDVDKKADGDNEPAPSTPTPSTPTPSTKVRISKKANGDNKPVPSPKVRENAGQGYVIFGQRSRVRLTDTIDLANLDRRDGFVIHGQKEGDLLGYSVSSAGDVNNDLINDVIVGAPNSQSFRGNKGGQSYVIYGQRYGFESLTDTSGLNPRRGSLITGALLGERSGFSVANAGDVNGDRITDLIIGAPFASPKGYASGQSYVVFGKSGGLGSLFDILQLNGLNGFVLNGFFPNGQSGYSVSGAGDVNGDRIDDLLIGAPFSRQAGPFDGQSYVVFGKPDRFMQPFNLDTLDGSNGWTLNGGGGQSGFSVTGLGDVNSDRIGDLGIGAPFGQGWTFSRTGQGYVMFGRPPKKNLAQIGLEQLKTKTGLKFNGRAPEEGIGYAVAGKGDFNGDRITDFVITAPLANPNGVSRAGKVYIVFGQPPTPPQAAPIKPAPSKRKVKTSPQGGGQLPSPKPPTPKPSPTPSASPHPTVSPKPAP